MNHHPHNVESDPDSLPVSEDNRDGSNGEGFSDDNIEKEIVANMESAEGIDAVAGLEANTEDMQKALDNEPEGKVHELLRSALAQLPNNGHAILIVQNSRGMGIMRTSPLPDGEDVSSVPVSCIPQYLTGLLFSAGVSLLQEFGMTNRNSPGFHGPEQLIAALMAGSARQQ